MNVFEDESCDAQSFLQHRRAGHCPLARRLFHAPHFMHPRRRASKTQATVRPDRSCGMTTLMREVPMLEACGKHAMRKPRGAAMSPWYQAVQAMLQPREMELPRDNEAKLWVRGA